MKRIITLMIPMLVALQGIAQQNPAKEFEKLKWLTGTWKCTNNKPGESGTESWQLTAPAQLTGKGVTLKGKKVTFLEKLSIVIKGNDIYYIADVSHEPKPVPFKMTSITVNSFVCENPEHDFPKKIIYTVTSPGHVKATITDGKQSMDYLFEKAK